jgi:hypothetical protein
MSKPPANLDVPYRPDPSKVHDRIDETVNLPDPVRLAAGRAEDLIAGKPPRSAVVPRKKRNERRFPYSDAEIDGALERWYQGDLNVNEREFGTIIALAREGAQLTKAHRRGAREQPRRPSAKVTRRWRALIGAFTQLSPKRKRNPTGRQTIEKLRSEMIGLLNLRDEDDVLSEDVIRRDIRDLRPILRLIQKGILPPAAGPNGQGPSEATRREMEAGRARVEAIGRERNASEPHDS